MDKINYNQHDWNKGEVIKEENLDNIENGIKQATDKINEIIDTEQDFKDRMADIDRRIDINNEELVIARDGCDNLGQRIERDQQYIYNILNDGSYLEFNGTDITVDNSKEGYTSNMVIKGQTYQNLINFNKLDKNYYEYSNGIVKNIRNGTDPRSWDSIETISDLLKQNTDYTFIVTNLTPNTKFQYGLNGGISTTEFNGVGEIRVLKFTTGDLVNVGFKAYKTIDAQTNVQIKIALLEGDWTNKEVPSEITGIESVGEKENNKISILSHGKNFYNGVFFDNKYIDIDNGGALDNGLNCVASDFIEVSPQTNYVVNNLVAEKIGFYDENKTFISGVHSNTLTTPHNAKFIRCTIKPKELKFQLEKGTTSTQYESYKEDKKEILLPIENGLKSLPNGTCDTIEQRQDGVYLVQRIEKVAYTEGDENLDNCITDKTISYKAKATPVETKLDIDTLNLETFKDKTYILSKNNIKPEIVCKAPVDVNQTIADLQEEQGQLIETYNTLKEENEAVKTAVSELNEQENVQTADMLDLDMRVLTLEEGLK